MQEWRKKSCIRFWKQKFNISSRKKKPQSRDLFIMCRLLVFLSVLRWRQTCLVLEIGTEVGGVAEGESISDELDGATRVHEHTLSFDDEQRGENVSHRATRHLAHDEREILLADAEFRSIESQEVLLAEVSHSQVVEIAHDDTLSG